MIMDWIQGIVSNVAVRHGKPCIQGTRIMVSVVLDNLADDIDEETILRDYPSLTHEDIRAAVAYGKSVKSI